MLIISIGCKQQFSLALNGKTCEPGNQYAKLVTAPDVFNSGVFRGEDTAEVFPVFHIIIYRETESERGREGGREGERERERESVKPTGQALTKGENSE